MSDDFYRVPSNLTDTTNALRKMLWGSNAPLLDEYNPLQAGLIGVGYATNSLIDNVRAGYYNARSNFANALGDPQAEAQWQAQADSVNAGRAENERIYEPLTKAYPYATAAGEAMPVIGAGLLGGGLGAVSTAPLQINWADRYMQELARAYGYNPTGVYGPIRQVLGGGSPVGAIRGLLNPRSDRLDSGIYDTTGQTP